MVYAHIHHAPNRELSFVQQPQNIVWGDKILNVLFVEFLILRGVEFLILGEMKMEVFCSF